MFNGGIKRSGIQWFWIFSLFFAHPAWAVIPNGVPGAEGWGLPWWLWVIGLFVFCFILGIAAVLGGVGGGVLYVPLVNCFFPFHLDFVRGAGIMVALAGSLAAGPGLLRRNLANVRLALPFALAASAASLLGAYLGLALPTRVVQMLLGFATIFISLTLLFYRNVEHPEMKAQDRVGAMLGMSGIYHGEPAGEYLQWNTHHTLSGLLLSIGMGSMTGFFGLDAGWAVVPVFNLLMGLPLKIAVGTGKFILSITDTSAAWVYLNEGCVIPLLAIPSIFGLMLGSFVGVRLLSVANVKIIRYGVVTVLLLAGVRAFFKGMGME